MMIASVSRLVRHLVVCTVAVACIAFVPTRATALFHLAVIDEVMTSYGSDANVQFVEIKMLFGSQNFVANSVLGAFDTGGNYIGDAWFFVDPGQQVHCFFLTAPDSLPLEERWWNWDIGHAIVLRDDGKNDDLGYPATLELESDRFLTVDYQQEQPGERTVIVATRWSISRR